ncbi:MAG: glycosyltransferase family 1 protein [Acidobacteria bacterium]|nr:MAG: glycosyltransferase family 1 protein [Acidobacteriota bacterium]
MRICLVVPYDLADEGGVKRHALHLAQGLRLRGDEVTVIGPLSRGEPGTGVRGFGGVLNVPANGAANYMAIFTPPWAVGRFFRENAFDVVHVHEPFVPLLAYYALGLSPSAAHVATFHMYAEEESRLWRTVRRTVGASMRRRIDRSIAVSRAAERFARVAWAGPMTVIPNGVPLSVFDGGHPPRERAADGAVRLLFVGNWRDARKGVKYLLEAYRRLRAEGRPLTLDIVGAGPPGPLEAVDGVTFHGRVSNEEALARHYRSCDVFVSPATGQESFGIVLLEAMAAGRPVVCSDIDGYRDVASPEGARLVPPGDAALLADAIRGLIHDEAARRRMGAANRQAVARYDWEAVTDRVREEYVHALALRTRAAGTGARARNVDGAPA